LDQKALASAMESLVRTIAALRHPETGCPWDLKQDHRTLRKYMIEEAYEASEAMALGDSKEICSELGDVLLQVVLNAQIAQDETTFDLVDVIKGIDEKMKRRHPHVFGSKEDRLESSEQVSEQWQEIKNKEKGSKKVGLFKECESGHYPASIQAAKIGKVANKVGFDWENPLQVFSKLKEEVGELEAEITTANPDPKKIEDELGDVFFSLAQVSRHLGIDPEVAAHGGNIKFLNRFKKLEAIADEKGVDLKTAELDQLESLWQLAKK
jgi:ATP diphosphatase